MNLMPLAWSFPCWVCVDCKQVVQWCDAVCEVEMNADGLPTDKLVAVRHSGCVDAI